jgi:hypothetical protein
LLAFIAQVVGVYSPERQMAFIAQTDRWRSS